MCEVQCPPKARVLFRHPKARIPLAPISAEPSPILWPLPFPLIDQFLIVHARPRFSYVPLIRRSMSRAPRRNRYSAVSINTTPMRTCDQITASIQSRLSKLNPAIPEMRNKAESADALNPRDSGFRRRRTFGLLDQMS